MKTVLHDIVNGLENLAVRLDGMESALIGKGILARGELGLYDQIHTPTVQTLLVDLRRAIDSLPK
jgi:hypothetical protein